MKNIIYLLLLFIFLPLSAQEEIPIPDKPGKWSYEFLEGDSKSYRETYVPAADYAVITQKLEKLANGLHRNPVLAQPKGFDPYVTARIFKPYEIENCAPAYGYVGEIWLRIRYWFTLKGQEHQSTYDPPFIRIYVNNPFDLTEIAFNFSSDGYDKQPNRTGPALDRLYKPHKIKDLAPGITLYRGKLIVSSPSKPLFLPVSLKELSDRVVRHWELETAKDPNNQMILDMVREEIKTFTPEQLKGLAYTFGGISGIGPQPNGDPVMRLNPDLFDRSLPKTAIQLITIEVPEDLEYRNDTDFATHELYLKRIYEIDRAWNGQNLGGLLDVK
jgi:hypothetical protein